MQGTRHEFGAAFKATVALATVRGNGAIASLTTLPRLSGTAAPITTFPATRSRSLPSQAHKTVLL